MAKHHRSGAAGIPPRRVIPDTRDERKSLAQIEDEFRAWLESDDDDQECAQKAQKRRLSAFEDEERLLTRPEAVTPEKGD
jgi:hypothetical protein